MGRTGEVLLLGEIDKYHIFLCESRTKNGSKTENSRRYGEQRWLSEWREVGGMSEIARK